MSEIVRIVRIGHGGDGVAEDGLFVPLTVPGDVVRVIREGTHGRIEDILEPGASRVAPPCPHFGRCGGCALQHVEFGAYLAWKREQVVGALAQRGLGEVPVQAIHAVTPGTRRRAMFKARVTGAGIALGFYEAGSRNLVDIRECPVLTPELAKLIAPLKKHLRDVLRNGETAELHATATDTGVDLALTLKRARDANMLMALADVTSACKLARLTWNGELVAQALAPSLRIGKFTVALPPGAFLQPTVEGERFLQKLVRDAVGDAKRVADLFSGVGTFALALADGRAVHAVESSEAHIAALTAAAKGARVTADTRDLFRRPLLASELARFDAVVIDPPRPGAKAQAQELARSQVKRVFYVSCSPASFARDARILVDGGYRLERVTPLDQFLWSPHVELFALFTRS